MRTASLSFPQALLLVGSRGSLQPLFFFTLHFFSSSLRLNTIHSILFKNSVFIVFLQFIFWWFYSSNFTGTDNLEKSAEVVFFGT